MGSFEATRLAPGRKYFNRFEVNGSKGSLVWCFEQLNELQFYSTGDPGTASGFRTIIATEGDHPYAGSWWPPGHMLGYDHGFANVASDLVQDIALERPCQPDFADGVRCAAVLDAVDKSMESARLD